MKSLFIAAAVALLTPTAALAMDCCKDCKCCKDMKVDHAEHTPAPAPKQ